MHSHIPARILEKELPALLLALLPLVGVLAAPALAPLVFSLAAAQFLYRALIERRAPRLDRSFLALALLFAFLSLASAAWSIVPARSLAGAFQITGIFAGALIFLGQPALPQKTGRRVMRAMALAYVAAALILAFDWSAGFPIEGFLSGDAPNAAAKYNRGVAYAVLFAWPVAGLLWRERAWRTLLPLLFALLAALLITLSLTAKLAALAALAAFAAAAAAPRVTGAVLAGGSALFAAFAPFLLRLVSSYRDLLAPYVKHSGVVRLEIWNYMTARVFQRPFLGWGFWSAAFLPISRRELESAGWSHAPGFYPHDQWLQIWVETGVFGAFLALVCTLLALKRARGLSLSLRPFAYASFAAAMTISLADFDLATDSWWAALAVCAYLFKIASAAESNSRL